MAPEHAPFEPTLLQDRPPVTRGAREPVPFTTGKAADLGQRFTLSEPAARLLTDDLTPERYLDLLAEKHLHADAVRVLAYGLPKREAVWWACLCLREALGANAPPKAQRALEAAEQWVTSPSEANRRAAKQAAEAAGIGTPAGLTALAASWSGGGPMHSAGSGVSSPDNLTAEGVAGAVLLAVAGAPPDDVAGRWRWFLALGLAVASGK
jgi:hypothetical protein